MLTIYNCVYDVCKFKTGKLYENPEFKRMWSNFMICRYISMIPAYTDYMFEVNKFSVKMTQLEYYHFLTNFLPKTNVGYINYISKPKKQEKKK